MPEAIDNIGGKWENKKKLLQNGVAGNRRKKLMKQAGKYIILSVAAAMTLGAMVSIWDAPLAEARGISRIKIKETGKVLLINKGEKKKIGIVVRPKSAGKAVSWSTSKKSVVSVNQKGIIRGKRYGTASITVKAKDGSGKKAKLRVQVGRKVSQIGLPSKSLNINVKESASLKAKISPSNATKRRVTYSSSNRGVATVSSSGIVYGKSKGTATITAKAQDGTGKKAVCRVQVKVPSQSVILDVQKTGTRLETGKTFRISAVVQPENASNRSVRYTSLNPGVAQVSQSGVVTGVSTGTTIIRVEAADGKSFATVEVEVYQVELRDEKLIAHRGFSSQAPENTTAAFELAVQKGFYGVECDVRKTLDDHFVIMHDADLSRMCGYNFTIANMDITQLKKYPIIAGNYVEQYPGLTVPTLEEYLEILAKSDSVHPFIELKEEFNLTELKQIVKKVKDYGLLQRTYFISYHKTNLISLKEIEGVKKEYLQYVYGAESSNKLMAVDDNIVSWCIQNEIDLDSRHTLITASDVYRLHEAGRKVNVWTVNVLARAYELVTNTQVDMITTEYYLNS